MAQKPAFLCPSRRLSLPSFFKKVSVLMQTISNFPPVQKNLTELKNRFDLNEEENLPKNTIDFMGTRVSYPQ